MSLPRSQQSYPIEPIAIIGMGCRFPGAANPEQFWQLLRSGADIAREIPAERWDLDAYYDPDPNAAGKIYVRKGYFLDDVAQFDRHFFDLAERETVALDPQQRLLLEVSWETLENANLPPAALAGSQTGLFISTFWDDYSARQLYTGNPQSIDRYNSLSNLRSMITGRLAHLLNVHGPSLQIDTACSASLTSIHLACQSLRNGECNLALAGGVFLLLAPEVTLGLCRIGALSADGRCKPFDRAADGFGQGEGCGMVLLKRLSDAQADGDTILALIRGSAINHDGHSRTVTTPNGRAQEMLLGQALRQAGITAQQVQYVEAHGTGTQLGDPIEVFAIADVYGQARTEPLMIGSVKSNIGHLNAAAGMASLLKVILALQYEELPPTLHVNHLSPYIPWQKLGIKVPTVLTPWPAKGNPRLAGISAFGLSGSNAHLLVEEAPRTQPLPPSAYHEPPYHLLPVSAKTAEALQAQVQAYHRYLQQESQSTWADICHTAANHREHFAHRLALVAPSTEAASQQLALIAQDFSQATYHLPQRHLPKVALRFTGQGTYFGGMGQDLYKAEPTFQAALDYCDEICQKQFGESLLIILSPSANGTERVTCPQSVGVVHALLARFAMEYALALTWQAWGVQPALLVGCGTGAIVAACVGGIFSIEDGFKLLAASARLVDESHRGINAEAYDSNMELLLDEFSRVAATITYHKPQLRIVTTGSGNQSADEIHTPAYWVRRIHEPVHDTNVMTTLHKEGIDICLDIGPSVTVLTRTEPSTVGDHAEGYFHSLHSGPNDWQQMLISLGLLYVRGVAINWNHFDQGGQRRKVALPTYPFQRRRYWLDTSQRCSAPPLRPLIDKMIKSPAIKELLFETEFGVAALPFLTDYRVDGVVVVPSACLMAMMLNAAELTLGCEQRLGLEKVRFAQALVMPQASTRTVQTIFTPVATNSSGLHYTVNLISFDTTDRPGSDPTDVVTHVTAQMIANSEQSPNDSDLATYRTRCTQPLDLKTRHRNPTEANSNFGPSFRWIKALSQRNELPDREHNAESLAQLQCPETVQSTNGYVLHHDLLDACMQVAAMTQIQSSAANKMLFPVTLASLSLHQAIKGRSWWCHVKETGQNRWDVQLLDRASELVATMIGLEMRPVTPEMVELFRLRSITQCATTQSDNPVLSRANTSRTILAPINRATLRQQLAKVESEQRLDLLVNYLCQMIAQLLDIHDPATIDPHGGLFQIGLSSLMVIQLRDQLAEELPIALFPVTAFIDASITKIAALLEEQYLHAQLTSQFSLTGAESTQAATDQAVTDQEMVEEFIV